MGRAPVDGEEGAADEGELLGAEVGHVYVGVLEPRVEHQPDIDHRQRAAVQRHHVPRPVRAPPDDEEGHHGQDTSVRHPHLRSRCE